VLIHNAIGPLVAAGFDVTILADMPRSEIDTFRKYMDQKPWSCDVFHVEDVAARSEPDPPEAYFRNVFLYKSHRFLRGLEGLCRIQKIDLVEFFEYCGSAYYTLRQRRLVGSRLPPVVVRIHGAIQLIDAAEGRCALDWERRVMYELESWSLANADYILTPSRSLGERYSELFAIEPRRMFASRPFPTNSFLLDDTAAPDRVVFFGKLQHVKGPDTFVDAAVALCRSGDIPQAGFVLIGGDAPHPLFAGGYERWLVARVPPRYRKHFRFTGRLSWDAANVEIGRSVCVVVPSRFESFGLAAHEIAASGIPLIVNRIPAFVSEFESCPGVMTFDGSPDQLAKRIREVIRQPARRRAMLQPRRYDTNDFVEAYRQLIREVSGPVAPAPPGARHKHAETIAITWGGGSEAARSAELGNPDRMAAGPSTTRAEQVGPAVVANLHSCDRVDERMWHAARMLLETTRTPAVALALAAPLSGEGRLIAVDAAPTTLLADPQAWQWIRVFHLLPEAVDLRGRMSFDNGPDPLGELWSAISRGEAVHMIPEPWVWPCAGRTRPHTPIGQKLRRIGLRLAASPSMESKDAARSLRWRVFFAGREVAKWFSR
jgi:glycosyltransferase involved in cell wall biosynthesis